jgi:hypothetical protein
MQAIPLRHLSRRWVAVILVLMMAAFSVPPLVNLTRPGTNMDYNLWQDTGRIALQGGEIYPQDGTAFPFMYPPPCASMLALISLLPEAGFVVCLVLLNSAAWAACIFLSVYLVTGRWLDAHPALYFWPSLAVIPLVHNTYLLGQPALVLLALLLGCFALLDRNRPFAAGLLLAAAAAIKAYPILAAGYLIYQRQWLALAGLTCGLLAAFFLLPLALRSPVQVRSDFVTWTQGMLFKFEEDGMAQRPLRSYSFKNQSAQATVHRLVRPVLADGEADPAWRVNVINLSFAQANLLMMALLLSLLIFYVTTTLRIAPSPPVGEALNQGMVALLVVFLAPLSFQYSYVWMLFPFTTMLHLALAAPAGSPLRRAAIWGLAGSVGLLLLSIFSPRLFAAYGNIFFAGCALFIAQGLILRSGWLREIQGRSSLPV